MAVDIGQAGVGVVGAVGGIGLESGGEQPLDDLRAGLVRERGPDHRRRAGHERRGVGSAEDARVVKSSVAVVPPGRGVDVSHGSEQAVRLERAAGGDAVPSGRAVVVQAADQDGMSGDALVRRRQGRIADRIGSGAVSRPHDHDAARGGGDSHARSPCVGAGAADAHVRYVGADLVGVGVLGSKAEYFLGPARHRGHKGAGIRAAEVVPDDVRVEGDAVHASAIAPRGGDAGDFRFVRPVAGNYAAVNDRSLQVRMAGVILGVDVQRGSDHGNGPAAAARLAVRDAGACRVGLGRVDHIQRHRAGRAVAQPARRHFDGVVFGGAPRSRAGRAGRLQGLGRIARSGRGRSPIADGGDRGVGGRRRGRGSFRRRQRGAVAGWDGEHPDRVRPARDQAGDRVARGRAGDVADFPGGAVLLAAGLPLHPVAGRARGRRPGDGQPLHGGRHADSRRPFRGGRRAVGGGRRRGSRSRGGGRRFRRCRAGAAAGQDGEHPDRVPPARGQAGDRVARAGFDDRFPAGAVGLVAGLPLHPVAGRSRDRRPRHGQRPLGGHDRDARRRRDGRGRTAAGSGFGVGGAAGRRRLLLGAAAAAPAA